MNDGGADRLACVLPLADVPDKQAAALVAIESRGQMFCYPERALDTQSSLETCRRADNGSQWWAYEKILEIPGETEAQSFFEQGRRDKSAGISTSPAGLNTTLYGSGRVIELPSTEARRMFTSVGSRVDVLPEVLAGLTGPLGDRVRRGFPESRNIAQPGGDGSDGRQHRPRLLVVIGSKCKRGPGPQGPQWPTCYGP